MVTDSAEKAETQVSAGQELEGLGTPGGGAVDRDHSPKESSDTLVLWRNQMKAFQAQVGRGGACTGNRVRETERVRSQTSHPPQL